MNIRHRARSGHTLIEVMFAVFIALVCVLIFAAAMPTANTSRLKADRYNVAADLASKQMENLKLIDPALRPEQMFAAGLIDSLTPIATDTWSFTNVDTLSSDNAARVLPQGTAQVSIEVVDIELRRVTITVGWVEAGAQRTVRIGTLFADLNN